MYHINAPIVSSTFDKDHIDMESTSFDYSTKNIPIPSPKDYKRVLIHKTELLCRRMRWRAFFYLNHNLSGKRNETFGFNSKRTPPQIPQMLNFENRLINMIENIKFRNNKCRFQNKLIILGRNQLYQKF